VDHREDRLIVRDSYHDHDFAGGVTNPLTNFVTGFGIVASNRASCTGAGSQRVTALRWYPRPKGFQFDKDASYYRAPGNWPVKPTPTDLRLLASNVVFKGQGNPKSVTLGQIPNIRCSNLAPRQHSPRVPRLPNHLSHV
jgi:hypothetical protein